nr:hypothetical protein [uncultured Oscillibacter sp.]
MAERRMFSKSITNSVRFLRMPQTSRLLYYDLGMSADDDGIVEAFTVIRTTGAAEDDLRVLASRGFITVLSDDLVSYITDWNTNNQLRKDRHKPSIYAELLVKIADGNQMATDWHPNGNQMATQVSIGKVSLVEGSEVEDKASCPEPETASGPPVISLPLNDGTEYRVFQNQCQEWADLYPAVDVMQQLRNMRGWLDANPAKRKTKRGVKAFINGWLSREQNRGGSLGQ